MKIGEPSQALPLIRSRCEEIGLLQHGPTSDEALASQDADAEAAGLTLAG